MHLYIITFGLVLFLGISYIPSTFTLNQTVSSENQNSISDVDNVKELDNELILLSDVIENRLEKAAAILEFTSRLPEMRALPFLNQFSTNLNGIPSNADMEKRQTGQEILSKYPEEFVSFLFLMPNGTVYLLEPFARQQNLSTSDLSHRDYYKGVIETNDTFLGNVITSLASGRNQAQLAVPVFDFGSNNDNASLIGVLSAGINFETYNKILQSVNLKGLHRILLLDSNGTKIADSDINQTSSLLKNIGDVSFRNLQSFNNAVKGETGTVQEMVNGSNTEIKYKPVKAIQKDWVLLLFRSSDISTYPNLNQTGNTTVNIPSDDTMLNSSIINKSKSSSSLNTTMPEQLPPQSINGSKVPKI